MENRAPDEKEVGGISWWNLLAAMLRTGIFTYGGGPAVIPLMRHEAVKRYGWMEDEEFGEIVALANALPGPIATKLAAYLGYRVKGILGAVLAVVVHILPSSLAMIVLLGSLYALKSSRVVAGMIAAVKPVIVVMLGVMAYEFGASAGRGLGWVFAAVTGLVALILLGPANVHPALVVLAALLYGSVHLRVVDALWARRPGIGAGAGEQGANDQSTETVAGGRVGKSAGGDQGRDDPRSRSGPGTSGEGEGSG
ncbi:MAG: chromate transporter [Kyrpidia tusciae]|nr:chromate transporter [Kyrpidia tusciae]MBE3552505.1 chromate transporter [Kyrpidia tusciae]